MTVSPVATQPQEVLLQEAEVHTTGVPEARDPVIPVLDNAHQGDTNLLPGPALLGALDTEALVAVPEALAIEAQGAVVPEAPVTEVLAVVPEALATVEVLVEAVLTVVAAARVAEDRLEVAEAVVEEEINPTTFLRT